MPSPSITDPIEYLVIGHVTKDLHPEGSTLGGTASFAALTALSLGLKVGIVTSCAKDLPLAQLRNSGLHVVSAESTTTFENIYSSDGRTQILHHRAALLGYDQVPATWRNSPIVHLGPVDQEVDFGLVESFPNSFIGITPQGWFRKWDSQGHVSLGRMPNAHHVLEKSSAVVISIEDVLGDESRIEDMVRYTPLLVVTEGASGARLYWNGDMRYFRPPSKVEVDPTGAGDIFATAFFFRFHSTGDAWEAARFATILAATSVTRKGLLGTPTPAEIKAAQVEIFSKIDTL
jgi:sugar/nucleoside kinase (ribokinase family)